MKDFKKDIKEYLRIGVFFGLASIALVAVIYMDKFYRFSFIN